MVDDPIERYPRFFVTLLGVVSVLLLVSVKFAFWATTGPYATPKTIALSGWALGGLTVLLISRIARWFDHHEPMVESIERRLGGDV